MSSALPSSTSSSSASTSHASDESATTSDFVDVFFIRHAERLDEADRPLWHSMIQNQQGRWHDPPLTTAGKQQAQWMSQTLKPLLNILEPQKIEKQLEMKDLDENNVNAEKQIESDSQSLRCAVKYLYSSPLLRVMQTTEAFSSEYGLPVLPVPALAACAQAITLGQSNGFERPPFCTDNELKKHCPTLYSILPWSPELSPSDYDFSNWCISEILRHQFQTHFLFFTHREGIREIMKLCGIKLGSLPYCAVAQFQFQRSKKTWTLKNTMAPPQDKFHKFHMKKLPTTSKSSSGNVDK